MREGLCQAIKAKKNTRTQPALTESASNGLRPPVDGNIIMGNVDPGTWARSKRATRWNTDEDVLLAIGGAACCGRASGDQHILKDDRPISPSARAKTRRRWHGAPARLRLAGPSAFCGVPAARRTRARIHWRCKVASGCRPRTNQMPARC